MRGERCQAAGSHCREDRWCQEALIAAKCEVMEAPEPCQIYTKGRVFRVVVVLSRFTSAELMIHGETMEFNPRGLVSMNSCLLALANMRLEMFGNSSEDFLI